PFRLLLREGAGPEQTVEADVVLDTTGTYCQHRWLGAGGIPAMGERDAEPHIAYRLEDILGERRSHYVGRTTMVIGTGYSGATSVCHLAELAVQHPKTRIIWLARAAYMPPLPRYADDPLQNRDQLAERANSLATQSQSGVEFHPETFVETIELLGRHQGFRVT